MSYVKPKPKHLDDYALFAARQYFTLRGFHVERIHRDPRAKCFDLTAKRSGLVKVPSPDTFVSLGGHCVQ